MQLAQGRTSGLLLVTLALAVLSASVRAEDGWRYGRATFYGDQPWLWDIHKGSCGFGQIDGSKGTGWDVAALPDVHYEYQGSCGKCYEVKCDPRVFTDGYGNTLDRSGDHCYDPNKVITVTITDTCPCEYSGNYYSNKRWCCGDTDHLDLSVYAFDKLAERRWGVIGLKYRPVACPGSGYTENPAPQREQVDPQSGVPEVQAFSDDKSSSDGLLQALLNYAKDNA